MIEQYDDKQSTEDTEALLDAFGFEESESERVDFTTLMRMLKLVLTRNDRRSIAAEFGLKNADLLQAERFFDSLYPDGQSMVSLATLRQKLHDKETFSIGTAFTITINDLDSLPERFGFEGFVRFLSDTMKKEPPPPPHESDAESGLSD